MYYICNVPCDPNYLEHHGIKGQKWGVRRFQNADGSFTANGRIRYFGQVSGQRIRDGAQRVGQHVVSYANKKADEQRSRTKKALDFWGHDVYGKTAAIGMTVANGILRDHGIRFVASFAFAPAAAIAVQTGNLTAARIVNAVGSAALLKNAIDVAAGVASTVRYKDEPKKK